MLRPLRAFHAACQLPLHARQRIRVHYTLLIGVVSNVSFAEQGFSAFSPYSGKGRGKRNECSGSAFPTSFAVRKETCRLPLTAPCWLADYVVRHRIVVTGFPQLAGLGKMLCQPICAGSAPYNLKPEQKPRFLIGRVPCPRNHCVRGCR